jgi:hypothetical protein
LVTHYGICRVEGYGLDSDEELFWSWFWGTPSLKLKGLAFGQADGGEVGGHLGLLCKVFRIFSVSSTADLEMAALLYNKAIIPNYLLSLCALLTVDTSANQKTLHPTNS